MTVHDLDVVIGLRRRMYLEMGTLDDERLAVMLARARTWFAARIASGTFCGFLIEMDGSAVAGGGFVVMDWPPTVLDPGSERAYIFNVFVDTAYRRRGMASRITMACLEACRERGIGVVSLHGTASARALYEHLGFTATNEMRFVERAPSRG